MDADLLAVIGLSLKVSGLAVLFALIMGAPVGAALAIWKFPGRQVLIVVFNSLMALPPVVVGLSVYLLLSRSGPLGSWGILFTPKAMIIAQTALIFPIIVALTREAVQPVFREYRGLLISLNASPVLVLRTVLWDARFGVVTALLAGFGRAIAEVGAVIIVGGNINGLTRVMTTTIALETSKGDLELAMALGIVLITLALTMNAMIYAISQIGRKYQEVRE
ncbi:MAG: ABC transporter permease [Rhodobacteraceae bacterium]|nr:ABC transporter permease [Paracoccaceae bacterium]